nr:MAG TPA: hypothetical protein [Caudoviricetes sp.]
MAWKNRTKSYITLGGRRGFLLCKQKYALTAILTRKGR